jgi:hypothetical protein
MINIKSTYEEYDSEETEIEIDHFIQNNKSNNCGDNLSNLLNQKEKEIKKKLRIKNIDQKPK